MTIADKLTLLANTKEALRAKLKLAKSVPFSKYPDYVNWQNAPSIPNKAFYADFTNDRYVKDGVPCNFKDLFTFNRAGKAWLVKDTGLQEYAADVPRLDNGLLIEQSATNLREWSTDYLQKPLIENNGAVFEGSGDDFNNMASIRMTTGGGNLYQSSNGVFTSSSTVSYYVKGQNNKELRLVLYYSEGVSNFPYVMTGDFIRVSASIPFSATFVQIFDHRGMSGLDHMVSTVDIAGIQYESSTYPSSYIPTGRTPVTRPADFLDTKITGTTVTGDWDSTLTLSIVNGQLVHSGYGRIRSLEVN